MPDQPFSDHVNLDVGLLGRPAQQFERHIWPALEARHQDLFGPLDHRRRLQQVLQARLFCGGQYWLGHCGDLRA
jgi:hypothetical protein